MMLIRRLSPEERRRRGSILTLSAFTLIGVIAFAGMVIDLGSLTLAKNQLQNAADAAAMAAVQELTPNPQPTFPLKSPVALTVNMPNLLGVFLQNSLQLDLKLGSTTIPVISPPSSDLDVAAAMAAANSVAAAHGCGIQTALNLLSGDMQATELKQGSPPVGLLPIPFVNSLLNNTILNEGSSTGRAFQVTVRRDGQCNGSYPLAFSKVWGRDSCDLTATATAALLPATKARAGAKVLPLALDITLWRAVRIANGAVNAVDPVQKLLASNGAPVILLDEKRWDPVTGAVTNGSDGVYELMLLTQPLDQISLPGLSWLLDPIKSKTSTLLTVAVGGATGAADQVTQINNGLSTSQVPTDGLALPFSSTGQTVVSSSTLKSLKGAIGKPFVLPLYDLLSVKMLTGSLGSLLGGRSTQYQIVGWTGVVITDVQDLGIAQVICVQAAPYVSHNLHQDNGGKAAYVDLVYRSPTLIK